MRSLRPPLALTALAALLALSGCFAPSPSSGRPASSGNTTLVIYSGRNENLVGPLIDQFRAQSGLEVEVRYGETAEMAATILEEGDNSPADLFFGQDAGALGALAAAGRLVTLPANLLDQVDARFRSRQGQWVGTSGRARVLVYNTEVLTEADLPDDIWGLTEARWRGRVGWAPTNGSFQAFVTALRKLEGEDQARAWLEAMIANDVQVFPGNTNIVAATGSGEIWVGLVNHYYLFRFLAEEGQEFPARNYTFRAGGAGSIINVAGVGILNTSGHQETAQQFVRFLLSPEAQQYFATETDEYPLIEQAVTLNALIQPWQEINAPDIDLSDLADLQGTLELLQATGAL